jgi:hypothetical protein
VISTDLVATDNVRGSNQLGRVVHEVITFTVLGRRLLELSAVCRKSEVSVERCVLSF